ncbi:similar to An08g12240 [Aspergillus luchuensis]|uniref:Similar to An08g12240 n=1 Tax=Aspergillus kawachii TaxID=1069201 RepID=A0A146FNJ6_ASPKA|nr:similar to An08g12240 [Aspergillus luchuensis]
MTTMTTSQAEWSCSLCFDKPRHPQPSWPERSFRRLRCDSVSFHRFRSLSIADNRPGNYRFVTVERALVASIFWVFARKVRQFIVPGYQTTKE